MSATPPRQTAADFDPEVLRLFDQYVHGQIDRRGFLDRAARVAAGSAGGAAALLAALSRRSEAPMQLRREGGSSQADAAQLRRGFALA